MPFLENWICDSLYVGITYLKGFHIKKTQRRKLSNEKWPFAITFSQCVNRLLLVFLFFKHYHCTCKEIPWKYTLRDCMQTTLKWSPFDLWLIDCRAKVKITSFVVLFATLSFEVVGLQLKRSTVIFGHAKLREFAYYSKGERSQFYLYCCLSNLLQPSLVKNLMCIFICMYAPMQMQTGTCLKGTPA